MLRKFKIAIDGTDYLVEMEEIGEVVTQVAPPSVTPVQPVQEVVSTPVVNQPVAEIQAGSEIISAPMPGTVLKVMVNVGDAIVANQPLLILEAMKMENEIVASKSGVVQAIPVSQGDMVNPGDALIGIA